MISKKFLRKSLLRNFHRKNFQNSCNPGESCFKFWMKCLNYLNFVTQAFLTGWYLFIFFPVAPFCHTPISHTAFLLRLARYQHCNLGEFGWCTQAQTGSRGLCFPCCSILQRNFPNFGMEILASRSAKSFPGLFFLILFSCST